MWTNEYNRTNAGSSRNMTQPLPRSSLLSSLFPDTVARPAAEVSPPLPKLGDAEKFKKTIEATGDPTTHQNMCECHYHDRFNEMHCVAADVKKEVARQKVEIESMRSGYERMHQLQATSDLILRKELQGLKAEIKLLRNEFDDRMVTMSNMYERMKFMEERIDMLTHEGFTFKFQIKTLKEKMEEKEKIKSEDN